MIRVETYVIGVKMSTVSLKSILFFLFSIILWFPLKGRHVCPSSGERMKFVHGKFKFFI